MAEKRQLALHLLRYLPFELKDDFLTVGLMLVEDAGRFADVRFTKDWRMLQCVAPDTEVEWFELMERDLRDILKSVWQRKDLERFVGERAGNKLELAPSKAVLTDDPALEMGVLASMYFSVPQRAGIGRPTGRAAIRTTLKDGFDQGGVLPLMQENMALTSYTGMGDPFRIDFGYRADRSMKLFHAVSLSGNVDQALALAYRYSRIQSRMLAENLQSSLTAVVEQELRREDAKIGFAIGMLKQSQVRVRGVGEMAAMVEEVRRELRA